MLYAALEDNPRRLQNRLLKVLGDDPVPDDLHITTSLPRLPDLSAHLDGWLEAHPTPGSSSSTCSARCAR